MSPLFKRKKSESEKPMESFTSEDVYDRLAKESEQSGQGEDWWRHCIDTAATFLEQDRFDDAIDRSTLAIKSKLDHPEAYFIRSAAYSMKGELPQAVADLTKAIDLGMGTIAAYSGRATLYFRMRDFPGVIADCTEIIRLDSQNAWAYKTRFQAYSNIADWGRAMEDFEIFSQLSPGEAQEEIAKMQERGLI